MILDPKERPGLVYRAEWLSWVVPLRPLGTIQDAQLLVNYIVSRGWWARSISGIKTIDLVYIPAWDRECAMLDGHHRGVMEISVGGLTEGLVYHELAHCARGDTDNSHGVPFLKAQFEILRQQGHDHFLPGYARQLLLADLVTGRERWLLRYLKLPDLRMTPMADDIHRWTFGQHPAMPWRTRAVWWKRLVKRLREILRW